MNRARAQGGIWTLRGHFATAIFLLAQMITEKHEDWMRNDDEPCHALSGRIITGMFRRSHTFNNVSY